MRRAATMLLPVVLTVAAAGVLSALAPSTRAGSPAFEFDRGTLDVEIAFPTSLTFGPDGRLYVAGLEEIRALTLDPSTKAVLAEEPIATGLEDVTGIAFDPTAPASPVVLYASNRDETLTDGFEGTITTFTGPTWTQDDVITGLPTSRPHLNHFTNGLAFDANGTLFIAQGSSTDNGVEDPEGLGAIYWPETPLTAAILVADIHAPGFDGTIVYDPAGPPADDNVDLVGGDVAVFASGIRNPYDLVIHSNGLLYATDNAAFEPVHSATCSETAIGVSTFDELNLVEEGNYYGHPNRNRGRTDERQCTYRRPQDGDGAGVTGPIAILPSHCSCDGIVEYTSMAFGGALKGDLLIAEWSNGVISRVELSNDGRSVVEVSDLAGDFGQPLDVTVGPDGTVYVADFSQNTVHYLRPLGQPTATPTPTGTPTPTSSGPTPTVTSTSTSSTPTTPPEPWGDVDCNLTVSAVDAALILQLSAALADDLPCLVRGDVNGDGLVNAVDASLVLQFVAGLVGALPV